MTNTPNLQPESVSTDAKPGVPPANDAQKTSEKSAHTDSKTELKTEPGKS